MSQASLLIIDDDVAIRSTLDEPFSESYGCHAAAADEEALRGTSSQRYDVIILDVSLPGMSGLENKPLDPTACARVISTLRDGGEGAAQAGAQDSRGVR